MFVVSGGFDLLGRTKDQIRTTEQVNAALKACTVLKLDGLVIIGGTYCSYIFQVFVMVVLMLLNCVNLIAEVCCKIY